MKIPVYQTGRVGGGNTLPGVSFSARKNPRAMAQAEMDKAKPMLAAMEAATQFQQKRYEFARDNLLDEAVLGAQRTLRNESRLLAKDPDYNNVLDGENPKWQDTVEQVRSGVSGKLFKDKYSQTAFRQKFDQLVLNNEFWLRGEIDTKVINTKGFAFDQALLDAELNMANPNQSVKEFETELGNLGTMATALINKYGVSPGPISTKIRTLLNNVAERTTVGYVGFDAAKVFAVEQMLPMIDLLSNENPEVQQSALAMIPEDMAYTANVLSKVPPSMRVDAINKALSSAIKLDEFEEKKQEELEKFFEATAKTAYVDAFEFKKTKNYSIKSIDSTILGRADLTRAMVNFGLDTDVVAKIKGIRNGSVDANDVQIKGTDAQKLILSYLQESQTTSFTQEKQKKLTNLVENIETFAEIDDAGILISLIRLEAKKELNAENIIDFSTSLTQETFLSFIGKVKAQQTTGFTKAEKYLNAKFKVIKLANAQADEELVDKISSTYSAAVSDLLDIEQTAETPLTAKQLYDAANDIWDQNKDIVKEFYLEEYNDTYTDVSETINNALRKNNLPDFVIDRNNPIKSLKDFAKTISEDSELESSRKNGIEAVIARQLSQFSVFQDTGIFDE